MPGQSISVIVSVFHPFPTISFSLPQSTPIACLPQLLTPILPITSQSLSTASGKSVHSGSPGDLSNLNQNGASGFLHLRLVPRVLGGKGGFGSQLRAAGGRMSSQKTQNNDSCRDLSGRRLSTIKEAQKLAAAIASEPERQEAKRKEAEERLADLNQEIARLDALVNGTDDGNIKKRRLNDSHQLAQSKEGIEKVRNAMAMAMLKKKKKQQQQSKEANQKSMLSIDEEKLPEKQEMSPVAQGITAENNKIIAPQVDTQPESAELVQKPVTATNHHIAEPLAESLTTCAVADLPEPPKRAKKPSSSSPAKRSRSKRTTQTSK